MRCEVKHSLVRWGTAILAWLAVSIPGLAADLSSLCADRTAIERVYYQHRLGEKPPFEESLPRAILEHRVRLDLRKEERLKQAYGVAITSEIVAEEVRRIDATTHDPAILAELKAALGNDPARFAQTVARPIVVERELRRRFENDDALHAARRREAAAMREQLLAARSAGVDKQLALLRHDHEPEVSEITWQLVASTDEKAGTNAGPAAPAQTLFFEDLPEELRKVLAAQLRQPGDVSAVIETPSAFLLYIATAKTATVLGAAALNLPKRSYEQWLEGAEN